MIEKYLRLNEGKTLEFKENADSLMSIIRTVIAFANTAGGTIIIGVRDRTREIIGLEDPLHDEERVDNSLADQIAPLLLPDISIVKYRGRDLIVIEVPHTVGPFYLKSAGPSAGTFVRFGSTNRAADEETHRSLGLLSKRKSFDELPCIGLDNGALDIGTAQKLFQEVRKDLTDDKARDLGLYEKNGNKSVPSNGGILLFGTNKVRHFPDARVMCARFDGTTKDRFIDELEVNEHLPQAIEPLLKFIERNSKTQIKIGRVVHTRVPQYPTIALREAIVNALLHADYAISGFSTSIAMFDDRIEITNPGSLVFGLTLKLALTGSSRLRNHVIGRVFKELGLIERWGSGLMRIIGSCQSAGLPLPHFEDLHTQFRVTIYAKREDQVELSPWQKLLIEYLQEHDYITTTQAATLLSISSRTARLRLSELSHMGILYRVATSDSDPKAHYILSCEPLVVEDFLGHQ